MDFFGKEIQVGNAQQRRDRRRSRKRFLLRSAEAHGVAARLLGSTRIRSFEYIDKSGRSKVRTF